MAGKQGSIVHMYIIVGFLVVLKAGHPGDVLAAFQHVCTLPCFVYYAELT